MVEPQLLLQKRNKHCVDHNVLNLFFQLQIQASPKEVEIEDTSIVTSAVATVTKEQVIINIGSSCMLKDMQEL